MSLAIKSKFDLTIIGGGIIGLATARQAAIRHPKLSICVLEKEKELATHQSKRNSGVVHCGIYYKKNSLKSRFCIRGAKMVKDYCQKKNLPYNQCGKLIVATRQDELGTLHDLFANAKANRIEGIEMLNSNQVENIQPGLKRSLETIWSPNTAIVNWQQIALSYAEDFKQLGGTIINEFTAAKFEPGNKNTVLIQESQSKEYIESGAVVNCAGLFSEYIARQTGNNEHPKVVPFRGHYYTLGDKFANTIRTNIYPVPNPKLPFLGVHITPTVDGSVLVGPTALLCLSYEKYCEDDFTNIHHTFHIVFRSGFWKMIRKKENFMAGLLELRRTYFKDYLVKELNEFLPGLQENDLIDNKFSGIRAQVVDKGGELVDDFLFETGFLPEYSKVLHVRNCPSPAATSSLALADRIVQNLEDRVILN